MKIIFLTLLPLIFSAKIPPNFPKCNRKDENFKKCVLEAARKVIPQLNRPYDELNIPNLNPYEVKELKISGGTGAVNLEQKFTNCKLYGFDSVKLDHFEFNFDKNNIVMSGVAQEIRMLCQYSIKGQVLLLHVNGEGNSSFIIKNLKVDDTLLFEINKKNNKSYMKPISSSIKIKPELVIFDFLNSKDRLLSDRINPILNDNWQDVFEDVQDAIVELLDKIILTLANGFFSKVTVEDAFDN